MLKALPLLCLLLLAACKPAAQPPAAAPQTPPAEGRLENDNLLNIVFGTAVIERSNELSYDASVVHALDGTPLTIWRSAPGGRLSTVVSLGALTRLRRVGATVPPTVEAPAGLLVEASLDGKTWRKALDAKIDPAKAEPQLFDVPNVDARYLRITAVEPVDYYTSVASLHAIGSEIAPFVQPPIEGCWEINHEPARFERRGARVTGTFGAMILDGGTDGRVYRLQWRERMNWGYAAVSISADGNHLSGLRWHEEVNPKHNGDGWLGTRVPCTAAPAIDGANIVDALIARAALWRMYGVRFDRQDRIIADESASALDLAAALIRDHPKHRFRVVARELREPVDAKNRARADAKLQAMREALRARGADLSRIEFFNAGNTRPELSVDFTGQRAMDSGVELQVLPLQ